MKFRILRVEILATDGQTYGYEIKFSEGLNIIRGDNSSGKSTFVNSLIYSLGMEEIIGSKGASSLPYALKKEFECGDRIVKVVNSIVYIEVENKNKKIVTFKRSIKSDSDDVKLINIIEGPYLSSNQNGTQFLIKPTFLHDSGSAQDPERGFFAYLEKFIGLSMPSITDNKGKETRLYLQAIFAALIVEQKRGWTDYIANIPYYGVSGVRAKVASFLLDLNVFRNANRIGELNSEKNRIISEWSELVTSIQLLVETNHFFVSGLKKTPITNFDSNLIYIGESNGLENKSLSQLRIDIFNTKNQLEEKQRENIEKEAPELLIEIEKIQNRIDELLILKNMNDTQIKVNKAQLNQYEISLESIDKDLKDNKLTKKLADFGANIANLNIAKGICGTCLQEVDDILLPPDSDSIPMTIDENIIYLDNQKKMTKSLLDGLKSNIDKSNSQLSTINSEIISLRMELISASRDIKSINSINETDIRKKIDIENKQKTILFIQEKVDKYISELAVLSKSYETVIINLSGIEKTGLTGSDWRRIKYFSDEFKNLASTFGYRSAKVDDIKIEHATMLPYLDNIELRANVAYEKEERTDIKSDSSASDFVRLIWSYLISLQKTSYELNGNHPNFILFDEPAQHSMSENSVNKLLTTICTIPGLQSIVAASFDESDDNFVASTKGLNKDNYNLIRLPKKIISKL
ncbi:AAA family ATPase [Photobacterium kishitanii]|uniref:AAA family ATPase n=2 Tax=Photobacterium kishitanii TaxID=318456 RepID=UPI000D15F350|nr:AAA family ATPase [Photobacterium kishitanii]PSW47480.1 hypothetical protein C0W66_18030 [Photobacterium kishitanii]